MKLFYYVVYINLNNLVLNKLSRDNQKMLFSQGYIEIPSDYSNSPYIISKKLINSGKKNLLLNSKIIIKCPIHLFHGGEDKDVTL